MPKQPSTGSADRAHFVSLVDAARLVGLPVTHLLRLVEGGSVSSTVSGSETWLLSTDVEVLQEGVATETAALHALLTGGASGEAMVVDEVWQRDWAEGRLGHVGPRSGVTPTA